jgi:cytochrome c556
MTTQTRTRVLPSVALVALGALVAAAPLLAQNANRGAQQIKYRQSAYTILGAQMGIMGAMASGRAPYDAKAFQTAADRAAVLASIAAESFPAGSDTGAPTKAKPEIWAQQAEFQKLMKDLTDRSTALAQAARSNNLDTIKPAVGALGGSCKACHDKYKLD